MKRVCSDVPFPPEHVPLRQTEWRNRVQMAAFSRRNCETRNKTNEYLPKLKVVGFEVIRILCVFAAVTLNASGTAVYPKTLY